MIRKLTESDWEKYQALRLYGLREAPMAFGADPIVEESYTKQRVVESIRESAGSFAIGWFDEQEKLLGVMRFFRETNRKTAHKGHIRGVYVHPKLRGQGIATKLFLFLLAEATGQTGLLQVHVAVNAENFSAKALYEKMGFVVYGREPAGLLVEGHFYDELLLILQLEGFKSK